MDNNKSKKKLIKNIKESFIENTISDLPLNTFDDLISQAMYCFPILTNLAKKSFYKIGSIEWKTIQNILYNLNLYMFKNSLDLQMHGNLNRIISRAVIYHVQCELQEADYIYKEYKDNKHLISELQELIFEHPSVTELMNVNISLSQKEITPLYYLSYFFISKAENFVHLYTPNIYNNQKIDDCTKISKEFNSNYINYKPSNEKILYFFNEIIRLTMFSRNTFALGAIYFLRKVKRFHKLRIYNSNIWDKNEIECIFSNKNDDHILYDLPTDQKAFNRIYNGLKQILDSYQVFNQEIYK